MNLSYRRFAQSKEESLGRAALGQGLQKMSAGSGQVRHGAGSGCKGQGRGMNQECSRPPHNAASERRESFTRDPRLARGCDVAQSHVGHRGRADERVSPPTEIPVTSSLRPPQSGQDDSALNPTPPPHPQPVCSLWAVVLGKVGAGCREGVKAARVCKVAAAAAAGAERLVCHPRRRTVSARWRTAPAAPILPRRAARWRPAPFAGDDSWGLCGSGTRLQPEAAAAGARLPEPLYGHGGDERRRGGH
ncbi:uncharacterized protein LOC129708993 [Leucoraja erinacea]|uniref:uncharacterized protein LOC129708993 n=1 Tax=Leucoraja erinaceus TaxID=7782 RepID=UPI002455B29B|nr:uncharacterized protein LOC129708993 [Leucoraja erinacea]